MCDALYDTTRFRRFLALALRDRFTARQLAQAVDRSDSWVSQMLSGHRPLNPELVESVARFLDLDEDLATYFAALVDLESKSARARRMAWATVEARQRHRAAEPEFRDDLVDVYANWYVVAILVLAECEGFRADPEWIATALNPPISVDDAGSALTLLVRVGALVPDDEGGLRPQQREHWSPSHVSEIQLGDGIALTQQAHLDHACQGFRRFRSNERRMTSLTVAMSEESYQRVAARLAEIERELVVLASDTSHGAPNRLFHLGIQLFPLSDYTDTEDVPEGEAPTQGDAEAEA